MEKRRVLVPINGSAFGRQIFPIIARFLSPAENDLILLHVGERVTGLVGAPPRPAGVDGMVMSYDTAQDAQMAAHPIYASQERDSALADFIADVKEDVRPLEEAGFDVTYDLRFGDRGDEIVNFADSQDVDLVAMTTHWRTGINRLIFGNTVQSIVPRLKVPLLMLRPDDGHETES
jgi:nucleotide-binding universal stress UspA family protein